MEEFVALLEQNLWVRLIILVGGVLGFLGCCFGIAKRVWYWGIPWKVSTDKLKAHVPALDDGNVVTLSQEHPEKPKDYGYLKNRLVKVNGIAFPVDYKHPEHPSLELHPIPFTIRIDVTCFFSLEDARELSKLGNLKFITVVGHARDGIQVGTAAEGFPVSLTLSDCRIQQPSILAIVQYLWSQSSLRHWWFFHAG